MAEGYRPSPGPNGPTAAPLTVPAQPSSVQPPTLLAEVRAAMKAAGMDPDTDPMAPLIKVLVRAAQSERGMTPEGERAAGERMAQHGARAVERALRDRSRVIAWRSGVLAACVALTALGGGFWWGRTDALRGCTVVPQPDGSRACVIVAWRDGRR